QELRDGHYAAGLLFAIIALYGYVLSMRKQHWWPALAGSFFYLLALLCKEIYFPLIGILPFLPEGKMKSRLRFSLPYGLVALVYIPWRFVVLNGGIGGHTPGLITHLTYNEIWRIMKDFFLLPQLLLGGTAFAYTILLAVSIDYFRKRRNRLPLLIVGLFLTLTPLAPLWLGKIERFDIFFWWSLSIYFTILLSTWEKPLPLRYLLAILILALSLQTWYKEMYSSDGSKAIRDCHDAASRFILHSTSQQVLYDSLDVWYPASDVVISLVEAEKELYPLSPRRGPVISDPDSLNSFLLNKATIWGYSDQCRCMEDITSKVPSLILDFHKKQYERPLFIHVKYEQKKVFWEVGPYNDGIYVVVFGNSNPSAMTLPGIKGTAAFDISQKIDFYLRYKSPNGWITRSPNFHYAPASDPVLSWSRK
ncbi:MAG TPA: hypothetical protein VJ508_14265, partial [Saprospiraceae bacterium]|nr:hypothetical protein [Saprospiraceae bacterium]